MSTGNLQQQAEILVMTSEMARSPICRILLNPTTASLARAAVLLPFSPRGEKRRRTQLVRVTVLSFFFAHGTVMALFRIFHAKIETTRRDTVSEWLRRWTRNPLGSARAGSNPAGVGCFVGTKV